MNKFFRKAKGSISIFLILIILPMFTCAGLVVDGSRISAARVTTSGAGDLALNSALSNYDQVLETTYGLLAMSKSTDELEKNVKAYFEKTLTSENVLEDSDSYTQNFINSIGSWFNNRDSKGNVEFDRLLDTKSEEFHLVPQTNSMLANPEVLERQIVEFMKYRGPVNLGSGLLEKLGCLKETSQQTKTASAKVDYEKNLSSMQDKCQAAYSKICNYNDTIENSPFKTEDSLNQKLQETKTLIQEMTEYILADKSPDLKLKKSSKDLLNNDFVKENLDITTGDNPEEKYEKFLEILETDYFELDKNNEFKNNKLYKNMKDIEDKLVNSDSDLSSQVDRILQLNKIMDKLSKAYTCLEKMEFYYPKMSEEKKEEHKEKYDKYKDRKDKIKNLVEHTESLSDNWEQEAANKSTQASQNLYSCYSEIDGIIGKLNDSIQALDDILSKSNELEKKRDKWGNEINKLSDGDVKTQMKGDYTNSAKDVNVDSVKDLIKVLKENKTYFKNMKDKLESISFYEKKLCISGSHDFFPNILALPENSVRSFESINDEANETMNQNYNSGEVITLGTLKIINGTSNEQRFYKELEKLCKQEKNQDEDAKKKAKENRKKLSEKGNETKDADVSDIKNTGNYVTDKGLTQDISSAIDQITYGQGSADTFSPKNINEGSDNDMADECQKNLDGVTSFLDNLSKVGENIRDSVYLEEYFTEMFSCYSSGQGSKGDKTKMNLRYKSMEENPFYRSEVEYILYGKDNAKDNLNCSKASIFGIRFALNSIFALTNSYTRQPAQAAAVAIAGWTGFGVPIVQTVLLLVWSTAESMCDLDDLCKGEAVVIYKSKDTWKLGPINLVNDVIEKTVNKVVDDIFDTIENVTDDTIESVETKVNEFVNQTTTDYTESIKSSISSTIETFINSIIGQDEDLSKEQIKVKLGELLQKMNDNATDATKGAISILIKSEDVIASKISEACTAAKTEASSVVTNKVNNILNFVSDKISSSINGVVSGVSEDLKTQAHNIIETGRNETKEIVQEKLKEAISNYTGNLTNINSVTKGGNIASSIASNFTLTYKEYLKTFMLIAMVGNKDAMLNRCAKLIQANVANKNDKFNITKAYTMVGINATVSVRTTFFDIPVEKGVDEKGNTTYDFEYSNLGTGRQNFKYVSVLGY